MRKVIETLGAEFPADAKPFQTEQDKQKAVLKAFGDVAAKYSGSDEAAVAQYYLGASAVNSGKLAAAEMALKEAIDSGNASYASLAKLTLAGVYQSEHKQADGERLLQSLVDKPTDFVSKEEATIALARYIASTDPGRAQEALVDSRDSTHLPEPRHPPRGQVHAPMEWQRQRRQTRQGR